MMAEKGKSLVQVESLFEPPDFVMGVNYNLSR